jgi:hypothetical protein
MPEMSRWTYSTTMPGTVQWHVVAQTFDSVDEAATAALRWLITSAEHNHFWAVKLERLDEIPMGPT